MRVFRTHLTTLLLALLVFATATGAVGNVTHAASDTPIHSMESDLDLGTADGDLTVGPLPLLAFVSLGLSAIARLVALESRRPLGRTDAPPDRPPTRSA
jgi:hypothetical protein